jgi:hypothetical protein
MNEYTCDNWVVIKMKGDEPHYRLLVGTSGGYLDGDSWRMNSGIERVERIGDYYAFHGFSGSVYECHVDSYGLRMNNSHIYTQLSEHYSEMITLMDESTEWEKIEYV